MKLRFAVFCGAMLLGALPTFAAKSPMKPGKWQITAETEMANMPMKIPPMTFTQCITEKDLEDAQKTVPQNNKNCKMVDFTVTGNKVTWKIECPKDGATGSGEATYEDDSYTGTMNMKMKDGEINAKYKGKRLGDCK